MPSDLFISLTKFLAGLASKVLKDGLSSALQFKCFGEMGAPSGFKLGLFV